MLGKCGKLDEAFEHIRRAEANGIALKTRAYSSLLQGLCEHGDAERAHALLALMQGRVSTAPGEPDFIHMAALEVSRSDREGLEVQLRALHEAVSHLQPSSFGALHAVLDRPSSGYLARTATVDKDGVCSGCGAALPAPALSSEQRTQLRDAILCAAAERDESIRADLVRFDEWLRSRTTPSGYIIDGANVGYRNQNFEGGSFSFLQVDVARQELMRRECRAEPLIVLPGHYFDDVVPNHSRCATGEHSVTTAERALLSGWVSAGALWRCPAGANDDWYWMLAAVEGGAHVRVLTNDEMRDHSFQMMLPRYFQRWKRRHTVKFDFSHGAASGRPDPVITISEPEFVREIHCCASGWHFPSGPDCSSWLCAQRLGSPEEATEGQRSKRPKLT
jgi:proteinaceous RNase P